MVAKGPFQFSLVAIVSKITYINLTVQWTGITMHFEILKRRRFNSTRSDRAAPSTAGPAATETHSTRCPRNGGRWVGSYRVSAQEGSETETENVNMSVLQRCVELSPL